MKSYDVVVIGGGPGGYVAAIRAAQLGLKTAVVEKEHLGGICLNWGCIPTKALLKASELYHSITHAGDFGISIGTPKVDVKKLIQRSRDVSGNLSNGVGFLMKKNNIDVIEGHATFRDTKHLDILDKDGQETEVVAFNNAIIATGATYRQVPGVLEVDGEHVWSYYQAMTPKKLPKSLLVIGSGAIGIEFASFYNTLGVDVKVVEAQDRILPFEDVEVSKMAEKSLKKRGMNFAKGALVKGLEISKKGVTATVETNGKTSEETYEKVLLAIGVVANVDALGLDKIDVRLDKGVITVDDTYQTNIPGIYAIGDVIGRQQLAHVASHEGIICAEGIAGEHPHKMDYTTIPACTYCEPQVASVGYTEHAAKDAGYNVKVGRFMYQANGKAQAIGASDEGMVKTVFDKETGELLGAHMIGAEATEMISTFVLGRSMEATEADILHACLPHPTLSEMIGEAVLDAEGRVINA